MMRALILVTALIGCGSSSSTCDDFLAAYCPNIISCGMIDPCRDQAGFKDMVLSKCRDGIANGKATADDFEVCSDHLRAGPDCGMLNDPSNPCAPATAAFH